MTFSLLPRWRRGLVAAQLAAAVLGGVLSIFGVLQQGATYPGGLLTAIGDALMPSEPRVASMDDARFEGALLLVDDAPFTGILLDHHPGGELKAAASYVDGLRHGKRETYSVNGVRLTLRTYRNDQKHGEHSGWWDDGTPRFQCSYRDGRYQGTCTSWYFSGQLATIDRYDSGDRAGYQEGWQVDGSLAYRFAVVDGRRYGLLPSKACFTTPYES